MSKSPLLKRLIAGQAAAPAANPPVVSLDRDQPGYVFPEERAKALFSELYPNEDPANYPRALYAIIRGLREVEESAVTLAEQTMFRKGVEEATRRILALVKDPATCVDPVTRQPTAAHFDWRNITNLLVERIEALRIQPPR